MRATIGGRATMYQLETMTVTPELAREWASTRPEHQRRLNLAHVKRLADAMTSGTFSQSPQPFMIDTDGNLLDGQHRAEAIALSGIPLESAVVVHNVNPRMFAYIDIGQRRTAAQFIDSRYSSLIASAARLVLTYERGSEMLGMQNIGKTYSIDQLVNEVQERPMLDLLASQVALVTAASHIHASTLLAVTSLATASQSDLVEDWLIGLNTGANLEIGDARLTLRNTYINNYKILNRQGEARRTWAYVVKAWNAYAQDEPVRILRFRTNKPGAPSSFTGEPMPRIYGS